MRYNCKDIFKKSIEEKLLKCYNCLLRTARYFNNDTNEASPAGNFQGWQISPNTFFSILKMSHYLSDPQRNIPISLGVVLPCNPLLSIIDASFLCCVLVKRWTEQHLCTLCDKILSAFYKRYFTETTKNVYPFFKCMHDDSFLMEL